ncbi:hypothetical protein LS70_001960 [Helicobacter sp. MIT 11-5569]|uniref:hypothetical protein n=1 Tax=Helicobacter sp. MIT 11-5569 TaxID=1548151 RepID=UPI00051FBCC6|nr:hypothetical protein [Helicobacter sp. MIT 11-5569]TLD85333.1 hypothetical protein LS70_001960 [Helicobacter sp. MIT 11-5569]
MVVFVGLNTFASDNAILYGQIINVDDANKTITIQNAQNNNVTTVQVFPNTKLHGKNCGLFGTYSDNERFSALQSGMFVEAKGYLKEEILMLTL